MMNRLLITFILLTLPTALMAQEKSTGTSTTESDIYKGITVFIADGCARCDEAVDILTTRGIDFKLINTTYEKEQQQLLVKAFMDNNEKPGKFKLPVILIDGKISHSHKDLKSFVNNIQN